MFIKKLSFYLCVVSLFSFNHLDAGLREDLSKKKYSFSESVLNEIECLNRVAFKGDSADAEEIFKIMWEDAERGNEKVQQKLLVLFSDNRFYERAKNRVHLLNDTSLYSLDILIDMGVAQKKSWAFYQKALIENDLRRKYILLNEAVNNLSRDSDQAICQPYLIALHDLEAQNNEQEYLNKNLHFILSNHKKMQSYIDKLIDSKSGRLLHSIYVTFKDPKQDNLKIFVSRCLVASSDLGYLPACDDLIKFYRAEKNDQKLEKSLLKLVKKGDFQSMIALGNILVGKPSVLKKKEGINIFLKAAEKVLDESKAGELMNGVASNLLEISDDYEDKLRVLHFYIEAEKLNNISAMVNLGSIYENGYVDGIPNLVEAAKYLFKAANLGDAKAMFMYGKLLRLGFGNQEPDKVKGNEWILNAANKGNALAMNYLSAYFMGVVDEEQGFDQRLAYEWALKASETGKACFLYNMGRILLNDRFGLYFDPIKAEKYLMDAADKGNVDAMIVLSLYYSNQIQKQKSVKNKKKLCRKAACWLQKAEEAGYFSDFINLTPLLLNKNTVVDNKIAFKISIYSFCFTKEQKISIMFNLAEYYFKGYLGERNNQNLKKAYELFLCAAKNNHVNAMYNVGMMFLEGVGTQKQNLKKAEKWFLRAAEKNHSLSMVELAKLLIFSSPLKNTEKSLEDALFWLQKADSMGEKEARGYLNVCKKLITENNESVVADDDILLIVEEKKKINSDVIELEQVNYPNEILEIGINTIANTNDNDVPQVEEVDLKVDFYEENTIEDAGERASLENDEKEDLKTEDESVPNYKNPKYAREQLRKIGLLKQCQEYTENDVRIVELSEKNQLIVDMLLDKSVKNKIIDYTQLVNLFADPFFENQVSVVKTKSGCLITAKNYKTLDYVVASTHKKHNKNYDGLNPFFARDLIKVLALFGLTEG